MKSVLLSGAAAILLTVASGAYAQQDQHGGGAGAHASIPPAGGDQHMDNAPHDAGAPHDSMSGGMQMSAPNAHVTTSGGMTGPNHAVTTHTTMHHTGWHHTPTHTTGAVTVNGNGHVNDNDHGNDNGHVTTSFDHNGNNPGHPHAQVSVKIKIAVNATHHFRAPAYRAPRGYVYRRYNVGERLEAAYFAQEYWLSDFAMYDLIAPPDGYTWVRFGPDAILVDEDTGEVVQVQYGVFV